MAAVVAVKAGEVYRAKVRRGYRYVEIQSVRARDSGQPYAVLREMLPSGKLATGRDRYGLRRADPWYSSLVIRDGAWRLTTHYEGPVELPAKPGKTTEGDDDNGE